MADMMTFPDTWEEYEKIYGFNDVDQVYINGSRLIPSFRVKQWLDHIAGFRTKLQTERAMKREDAIYWIKNLAVLSTEKDIPQIEEALNMAVEALQDEVWKDKQPERSE